MLDRRRPQRPSRRIAGPALLATTLAGGVAATALAQRRHLRALADDPELRALSGPLEDVAPEHAVQAVASADGRMLHAERLGAADAPATLVLAHGWTEAIPLWGPVIRRLASERLTIVAYDLRGHGQSATARGDDYALERFGEDLEAVLAALGGEPARTAVAGHSLGAMSIAAWARTGHMSPLERPGEVAAALRELLTRARVFGKTSEVAG
jgi:pimeloyl-ACP methyl ester carboxylesterase